MADHRRTPGRQQPMAMRTSDFDYPLDPELIAQAPAEGRDRSRLMVLDRRTGNVRHHVFAELPGLLRHRRSG